MTRVESGGSHRDSLLLDWVDVVGRWCAAPSQSFDQVVRKAQYLKFLFPRLVSSGASLARSSPDLRLAGPQTRFTRSFSQIQRTCHSPTRTAVCTAELGIEVARPWNNLAKAGGR